MGKKVKETLKTPPEIKERIKNLIKKLWHPTLIFLSGAILFLDRLVGVLLILFVVACAFLVLYAGYRFINYYFDQKEAALPQPSKPSEYHFHKHGGDPESDDFANILQAMNNQRRAISMN